MYTIFRAISSIFVNRKKKDSKDHAAQVIRERANDPEWPQVLMWPEGTTHNRLSIVKMKAGAFYPGLPVQPIAVKWDHGNWDTITWGFQGRPPYELIWHTFCQFTVNCEIRFLEPIIPTQEDKGNLKCKTNPKFSCCGFGLSPQKLTTTFFRKFSDFKGVVGPGNEKIM